MRTPGIAPDYVLYRSLSTADGGGPYATYEHGVNAAGSSRINVQVLVDDDDTEVTARVLFWSEAAEAFIPSNTSYSFGPSDESFEFSFPANGRIFFVEIAGNITSAQVYTSAAPEAR